MSGSDLNRDDATGATTGQIEPRSSEGAKGEQRQKGLFGGEEEAVPRSSAPEHCGTLMRRLRLDWVCPLCGKMEEAEG